jgi:hypothetical protein
MNPIPLVTVGGRGCCLAAGLLGGVAGALQSQEKCRVELLNVSRQAVRTQVTRETENLFAGGDVRLRCRGQNVRMWADSIASYQGQVIQFIGNFRYEDPTAQVTSEFGTYIRTQEKWEARGTVIYVNRRDGSRLEGPAVDYYRKIAGQRDLEEVFAEQRPRLTLPVTDSGRGTEPYVIVADRLRLRGQNLMWAGGSVTIDRSDLIGRADSLSLITGKEGTGVMVGHASIRRAAEDSFALRGKRIDLAMANRELTAVTGRDSATATSRDLELVAGAIRLRLSARRVIQTLAWGKNPAPVAWTGDYQVKGDSLAVDTPEEMLREFRSFGHAWVGFRPDTARGERDWLAGDSIRAEFVTIPAPGPGRPDQRKAAIQRLEARGHAASFYRLANAGGAPGALPSISYAKADRILLTMTPGDSVKVERVEMTGQVHGVQLDPATAADSLRLRPAPGRRPR